MEKMIHIFLVEQLDGSPAVVSAPCYTGSEGDVVIFGDSAEYVGRIVCRFGESKDSPVVQTLSAFTTIHTAQQIFRHSYSKEDPNGE